MSLSVQIQPDHGERHDVPFLLSGEYILPDELPDPDLFTLDLDDLTEEEWAELLEADPLLTGDLVPLPEYLDFEAEHLRLDGSPMARWLARQIDELAAEARVLHALTPDQFDDRAATYLEEARS